MNTTTPRIDVAAVKARYNLSAIIGKRVKLRKVGHEHVGLCPFHSERTPSFRVNDDKGVYHCFGCGVHGDAISFLTELDGLSFRDAVDAITNGDIPETDPGERGARALAHTDDRKAASAEAFRQWASARNIKGTPAEIYLLSRGIVWDVPWCVRFTWARPRFDRETGRAVGQLMPTLILACQDLSNKIVGVQRVFLTKEGKKAPMLNPKLSLGPTRGGAIRLGPIARKIILVEGPEDGLTLMPRHPDASIWVTLGTGSLPHVQLPPEVEEVSLAGDNNSGGRTAIKAGEESYNAQNKIVSSFYPDPSFEDFNDELRGIKKN